MPNQPIAAVSLLASSWFLYLATDDFMHHHPSVCEDNCFTLNHLLRLWYPMLNSPDFLAAVSDQRWFSLQGHCAPLVAAVLLDAGKCPLLC